jgi:hypothetical protein
MKTHLIAYLLIPSLVPCAYAAAPAAATAPSPVEVAFTGSLGYDNNVYLVDQGTLGRVDSVVSTVGAKVGTKFTNGASASYATTGSRFWNASDEDNVKHQLAAGYKRSFDALSVAAATEFAQVQGEDQGSIYGPMTGRSTFSSPAPRERRDQMQNKTDLAVRYDIGQNFVRGVGKLQYWDMQTHALPDAGAENYRDRYDLNGGADFGRAFTKDGPEYYLGYRRGYFYQDTDGGTFSFPAAPNANATSQYNRFLAGVDGKVTSNLKLAAQLGWNVNEYTSSYRGADKNLEGLYQDVTATWKAAANDELQLKTSMGRTVSGTSPASILASSYQLGWKHVVSKQWTTTLTGRVAKLNYDGTTDRSDVLYTGIAGLTWNSSATLAWTLSVTQEFAKNIRTNVTETFSDQAAFEHTLVSAGVTWKL